MKQWYEIKASYEKVMEDGRQKKVSEKYLADAVSFADAENIVESEIAAHVTGDFILSAISRKKVAETFFNEGYFKYDDGDRIYQAKVIFITLDENSGKEKHTANIILVQSNCIDEAKTRLREELKGTISDYTIASIAETNIVDVFVYENEEEK